MDVNGEVHVGFASSSKQAYYVYGESLEQADLFFFFLSSLASNNV
jgi:hypothetical protein